MRISRHETTFFIITCPPVKLFAKLHLLQLVAHPVDFLHVGEDHLGVHPALLHHPGHVLGGEEVRYSGELLSCGEGQVEVSPSVRSGLRLQGFKVKRLREEVVNESTEGQTVGPGLCEVLGMMRIERETDLETETIWLTLIWTSSYSLVRH